MLSILRGRLGVPGVVSVAALVFAMTGGAFAAKYLITSTKQISPSVLKKLKGKAGSQGPQGSAGAQGPVGPAGAAGVGGAPGEKGASGATGATGAAGAPGAPGATGATGETGATGATGATGDPWTAGGTLPPGKTETGTWAGVGETATTTSISFTIPLADDLEEANTIIVLSEETNENCDDGVAPSPGAAHPEADAGFLCVFQGGFGTPLNIGNPVGGSGAATAGATVTAETFFGRATGTLAVTAP